MSLARLAAQAAILAAALATACGGDERVRSEASAPAAAPTRTETPRPPARNVRIPGGAGHLAVMAPRDGLTVRSRPDGRVIAHLKRRTRWGSPTVVWAVRRSGEWLAVVAPGLENGRLGWIDMVRERPRMWRSRLSLHADLSERTLELRDGRRTRRRMSVTIGGPSSPTPTGRFAVTDKLIPAPGQAYYGCCILALSGSQPQLRPGWAGGDRIAIHGSPDGSVGAAASAGCLRARNIDLRALMRVVPVGTPVVIRA